MNRGSSARKKQSQQEVDADKLLEEVSSAFDEGEQSRKQILKMLDKRQKDNEELELESCFSELKQKAGIKDDEIESMANQSLTDLKEMQN